MVGAALAHVHENTNSKGTVLSMHGNPREAALVGYLAGIVDGEGHITIKRYSVPGTANKKRHSPSVGVGMTVQEIPALLQSMFGGGLRIEERVLGRKSMWRWEISKRSQVVVALRLLLPYLRVKKEQAKLALDCCESWAFMRTNQFVASNRQELGRREEAYWKMRKLNSNQAPASTNQVGTREGEVIVRACGKPQEGDPKRFPRQSTLWLVGEEAEVT